MVARLRAVAGTEAGHAATRTIRELRQRSEEFSRLWDRHDVIPQRLETKRLNSPSIGLLQLSSVSTNLAETGHRMTVMTPADETTSQRLLRLSEANTDASTRG